MLGSFWTFANILSICRIPLAATAAVIILMDGPVSRSLILIFMAGFTDFLDGMIARSTNTISGWGKILDPAADKFSVVLLGAALVWKNLLPFWFLGAIVIRDVLIVAGGTFLTHRLGRIHMSNLVGKVTTTAIGATFILGLLKADAIVMDIFIWGTVGLLVVSLLIYAARLLNLRNNSTES